MKNNKHAIFICVIVLITGIISILFGLNIQLCKNSFKETLTNIPVYNEDISINIPNTTYNKMYSNVNKQISNNLNTQPVNTFSNSLDISYEKPNILSLTKYNTAYNSDFYDSNNYDMLYHDPVSIILQNNNELSRLNGTWTKDANGELIYIKWEKMHNYPIYYHPKRFLYGPSNYVPSYEDSVILSKFSKR